MFDNTPSTKKFPNLYPHGALNQANTVTMLFLELSLSFVVWTFVIFENNFEIKYKFLEY